MSRLLVHVEGRTELLFVNEVLAPHLYGLGYTSVTARLIGGVRLSRQRGGVRSWESALHGIVHNFRTDSELMVSTMVDYYGMPPNWPGRANVSESAVAASERAAEIEDSLLQDVCNEMDANFNSNRFIPYVMMHEFEAMLFSDCDSFGHAIGRSYLIDDFQAIRDDFTSPEEIDDSPLTAPSKRIEALLPGFQKPTMGVQAAQSIGLQAIRSECPHFADWLRRLEHLP